MFKLFAQWVNAAAVDRCNQECAVRWPGYPLLLTEHAHTCALYCFTFLQLNFLTVPLSSFSPNFLLYNCANLQIVLCSQLGPSFLPGEAEQIEQMSVSISECMFAASVPSLLLYCLMNKQTVTRFVLAAEYPRQICQPPRCLLSSVNSELSQLFIVHPTVYRYCNRASTSN